MTEWIENLIDHQGGWVEDPDREGVEWRFTAEWDETAYDFVSEINGVDCYGRVATSPWNDGCYQRPSEFNGLARILDHNWSHNIGGSRWEKGVLWWQPTPDVWGTPKPWSHETFDDDFRHMQRLLKEGWQVAIVTRREKCECGQWTQESAVLGGIDTDPWDDKSYWSNVVEDLVFELQPEAE